MTTLHQASADPLAVVRAYYDGFNGRDGTTHERLFTADAFISGPGVPGFEQRGRQLIQTFDTGFQTAFPDCRVAVRESFVDGEV